MQTVLNQQVDDQIDKPSERFSRPTRGVLRLNEFRFKVEELEKDLAKFGPTEWNPRPNGKEWADIMLVRDDKKHGLYNECPYFQYVLSSFGGRVIAATLAQLGPGGSVGEHRDISGGTPFGVARFHIPIVTDPGVEFFVSGQKFFLAPGECWNLDTTYPHALNNRSQVTRVHLIIDVEMNEKVRSLLPEEDLRDKLHKIYFGYLCFQKLVTESITAPRRLWSRLRNIFKIYVLKKSSL